MNFSVLTISHRLALLLLLSLPLVTFGQDAEATDGMDSIANVVQDAGDDLSVDEPAPPVMEVGKAISTPNPNTVEATEPAEQVQDDSSSSKTMDDRINEVMGPITDVIMSVIFFEIPIAGGVPFVLIWLLLGAIFFTWYNGFINLRGFRHAIDVVRWQVRRPQP